MSGKPGSKPRLVIIEGKDKGKIIPLQDGTAVIGRSKGDVLVQDARVSRSHVAIHYDTKAGTLSFTDLKSLNGTLINGTAAETGELHDGDKLQLGDTLFDCQISAEGASTEPLAPVEPSEAPRLKKSKKKGPAEPKESALVETGEQRLRPFDEADDAPREPKALKDTGRAKESKSLLPAFRSAYGRIPQRVRNLALAAIIAGFAYVYLGKTFLSSTGNSSKGDLDREIAAIEAMRAAGQTDEAIAKAEETKSHFPESSMIYMELGQLYTEQRRYEPAIAAYQKASTLKPEQPVIPVRLTRLYLRSGLTQEAESEMAIIDQMMKEGKHSREFFIEQARLYLDFKDLNRSPERALILAKALESEYAKDSPIGYKLEAQALFQQNRNEEALQVLEKGLQIDPQDDWLLENLAFAKLSLKDIAGAGQVVENWIKVHPNATKALLVMAYLKFNDKNYPAALPYVQKIVQLSSGNQKDPLYPEALNLIGQIYLQQGNQQEAQSFLKQACDQGFQQACENQLVRATNPAAKGQAPAPASIGNNSVSGTGVSSATATGAIQGGAVPGSGSQGANAMPGAGGAAGNGLPSLPPTK